MTTLIANDFTAIHNRLDQIQKKQPDWMPRCRDCMDTGHQRILVVSSEMLVPLPDSWRRIPCPSCLNPDGKP